MATGKIKWYSDSKGLGFIEQEGGGGDIFFGRSSYNGDMSALTEGRAVEFDIVEKERGPVAKNIVCK